MCDFLTIIMPASSEPRMSKWKRQGFDLSKSCNSSIQRHLRPGYKQWVLTRGGCSCDLVKHAKLTPGLLALRSDVPDVLDELLGGDRAGFILVHTYSEDIATEEFAVCQGQSITTAALRSSYYPLKCDQLIPVVRQAREPSATANGRPVELGRWPAKDP